MMNRYKAGLNRAASNYEAAGGLIVPVRAPQTD